MDQPVTDENLLENLIDSSKQLLLDTKNLIKYSQTSTKESLFMDTARHAAHLVFHIENILIKIRQENSFLPVNSPQLGVMMNSYESVKDSILSLIKITKDMKGQTQSSFEETISNICKLLGASIKTMLISAEASARVWKDDKKANNNTRRKLSVFGTLRRKEETTHDSSSSFLSRSDSKTIHRGEIVNYLLQIIDSVKKKAKPEVFAELIKNCQSSLSRVDDSVKDLKMSREMERLQYLVSQFLSIKQGFVILIHRIDEIEEKNIVELENVKNRIEEALWWFEMLVSSKQSLVQLENQMGEVQMHSNRNRLDIKPAMFRMETSVDLNINNKMMIVLGLPLNDVIKTVVLIDNESPNAFIERMFEKYYSKKLPKMTHKDFQLKIPGLPQYLSGSDPLVYFPYIKESIQSGKKIELMLTEKACFFCHVMTFKQWDQTEIKDVPESVIRAEQRASKKPEKEILTYKGELSTQMSTFENNCKEVLAHVAAAVGVDASLMKALLLEDAYIKRLSDVKSKISSTHQDLLPLSQMMDKTILETFDQYEGIRQIADLRGIPDFGEKLFQLGNESISLLRKTMTACQVAILEHLSNSQNSEKLIKKATEKFEEAAKTLYRHFYALKSGILKQSNNVSSLREKNGHLNLNCLYARQFMTSIMETAVVHLKEIRGRFDDKIKTVQKLPEEVQKKLYTKFYGAAQFDMQVEKHFSALRPWVYQWVDVQVPSIVQREVFAKDRKSLDELMEKNKSQMVNAFKELLASNFLEPLIALEDLRKAFYDEIEIVTFACNL